MTKTLRRLPRGEFCVRLGLSTHRMMRLPNSNVIDSRTIYYDGYGEEIGRIDHVMCPVDGTLEAAYSIPVELNEPEYEERQLAI